MDSNHRRLSPTDLQSAPFSRSGTPPNPQLAVGLEPTTCGLQIRCATGCATPAQAPCYHRPRWPNKAASDLANVSPMQWAIGWRPRPALNGASNRVVPNRRWPVSSRRRTGHGGPRARLGCTLGRPRARATRGPGGRAWTTTSGRQGFRGISRNRRRTRPGAPPDATQQAGQRAVGRVDPDLLSGQTEDPHGRSQRAGPSTAARHFPASPGRGSDDLGRDPVGVVREQEGPLVVILLIGRGCSSSRACAAPGVAEPPSPVGATAPPPHSP